jgi:hypothetical protein
MDVKELESIAFRELAGNGLHKWTFSLAKTGRRPSNCPTKWDLNGTLLPRRPYGGARASTVFGAPSDIAAFGDELPSSSGRRPGLTGLPGSR